MLYVTVRHNRICESSIQNGINTEINAVRVATGSAFMHVELQGCHHKYVVARPT